MKKSLLITLEFPPVQGGISNYYYQLYSHLPTASVVILAHSETDTHPPTPCTVYYKNFFSKLPFIWPRWIKLFFIAKKIIDTEHIQCLHVGHILPTGIIAWLFKKLYKLPYSVFSHGKDILYPQAFPRKKRMMLKILKDADHVFVNSNYTGQSVRQMGIVPEKITVIYPCPNISPEPLSPQKEREILSALDIVSDKIILTVGRLMPGKGHDMVLRALPDILKHIPDAHYVIAGVGPEQQRLEAITQTLHIARAVSFLGDINIFLDKHNKEKLLALYAACRLFVMPARDNEKRINNRTIVEWESFGMVFLEANAFGKPVIGGRSGGQPEAIQDTVTGLLVDPDNQAGIAQAIISLLAHPEKATQLGENGKQRVHREFNWDQQAKKMINTLQAL